MSLPLAPTPDAATRWRHDLFLLTGLFGVLLLWDASGLDMRLVSRFGDAHGFAWNHHWFTEGVLHEGGRLLAGAVLLWLAAIQLVPHGPARFLSASGRLFWLLLAVACLLLVPTLKHYSLTSCPSELLQFGGLAHYVSHWAPGVADGGPGHCFPSGHASSAFAFIGGYFVLRESQPRAARLWLLAVLLLGAAYGWGQMMRGSHYLSHTLWTAWLCATSSAALAAFATARGWLGAAVPADLTAARAPA